MTLKSDAKFEEKLTLGSKTDMMNLVNFNGSSGKSENLHFDVLLLSKVYCVWAKKYSGVMCHNTEEWCKIWGGTDLCFEKWQQFGKFWSNTLESQNLYFNGVSLTKAYNIWVKKLQKSYLSLHLRAMQYLKKNWEEKLSGGLKNDLRSLISFHASSCKSEIKFLNRIILFTDMLICIAQWIFRPKALEVLINSCLSNIHPFVHTNVFNQFFQHLDFFVNFTQSSQSKRKKNDKGGFSQKILISLKYPQRAQNGLQIAFSWVSIKSCYFSLLEVT